jgi:peptide methionine sulfoxide reductase msrA/msrB
LNRQGPDKGTQYRSALFVSDASQRATAEKLIGSIRAEGYPIVTEVAEAVEFYRAEESHQDYFEKSGREATCHLRNWRESK